MTQKQTKKKESATKKKSLRSSGGATFLADLLPCSHQRHRTTKKIKQTWTSNYLDATVAIRAESTPVSSTVVRAQTGSVQTGGLLTLSRKVKRRVLKLCTSSWHHQGASTFQNQQFWTWTWSRFQKCFWRLGRNCCCCCCRDPC